MTYKLFILKPKVVFRAQVNQQSWPNPWNDQVTYDNVTQGSYTDIRVGMTVLFGTTPGGDDLGRQRIRKPATADTIYFGRSAAAMRDGEMIGVDNSYITVLDDYRVWSKVPYIADDGTIYKDSDMAYVDETKLNPPKANAGVYMAGDIDPSTGKLRVILPHESNSSFAVADGATITGYQWLLPSGVSLVPPSSNTDPQITVDCNPGFYWVSLIVTDSNGKTHESRVGVYAHDPTNDDNDVFVSDFTIESWRIMPEGQELTFTIHQDIPSDGIPDGTLVMLWKDNPASPSDRNHMMFVGWHDYDPAEIVSERPATLKGLRWQCVDVAGRMKKIVSFPQQVEIADDGNPTEWTKMKAPNLDKYLDYLMRWHSTVLEVADWKWSGTGATYKFVVLGSDKGSLWEQVNTRARAFVPNRYLTCTRRGQLLTRVDPMLQKVEERTTTVQWDITDYEQLEYTHQRTPRLHWLRGSAVLASDDRNNIQALFCYAPGRTPGQGIEDQEAGRQLTPDQETLNIQEGHRYARLQAHQSHFRIRLHQMIPDTLEPAQYQWVRVTMPASRRGLSFTNERGLIHAIDITVAAEREGLSHEVSIEWEREVVGTPAETYVPPPPDDLSYTWGGWEIQPPPTPTQLPDQVVCYIAGGHIYATANFRDGSGTEWVSYQVLSGESAIDACFDPLSPKLQGTGTELNGWIVTQTKIYRFTNALGALPGYPGSPSVTLQYTFAASSDWRTIAASVMGVGGNASVACTSRYFATPSPIKFIGSQDGGVTWTSESTVGYVRGFANHTVAWPTLWMSQTTLGKVATTITDDVQTTISNCGSTWYGYLMRVVYSTDFGTFWTPLAPQSDERLDYQVTGGGLHSVNDGTSFRIGVQRNTAGIDTFNIFVPSGCCGSTVHYAAMYSHCFVPVVDGVGKEATIALDASRTLYYGPVQRKSSFRSLDSNPSYMVFIGGVEFPGWVKKEPYPACGLMSHTQYGYALQVDHRIWITGDGGAHWTDISDGPDGFLNPETGKRGWYNNGNSLPYELSFHPGTPNVIYVWGKNFVGYSDNFGATWTSCRGNVTLPGHIVAMQACGNS